MTVLVAYASKHSSTYNIAERIADVLRRRGHAVEVYTTEAVHDAGAYDAVVIGSAVYYGRWLPQAVDFVSANATVLAGHPVWLFSDQERLSLGERLVTKAVHAPYGDFRDWAEIDTWAESIAEQIETSAEQASR